MQKTAYEIGISDWSSDVCSSDLTGLQVVVVVVRDLERPEAQPLQRRGGGEDVTTGKGNVLDARPEALGDEIDRKSVVQGKSVSVRVDLGGRRIIKKKPEIKRRNTNTHYEHSQQDYSTI